MNCPLFSAYQLPSNEAKIGREALTAHITVELNAQSWIHPVPVPNYREIHSFYEKKKEQTLHAKWWWITIVCVDVRSFITVCLCPHWNCHWTHAAFECIIWCTIGKARADKVRSHVCRLSRHTKNKKTQHHKRREPIGNGRINTYIYVIYLIIVHVWVGKLNGAVQRWIRPANRSDRGNRTQKLEQTTATKQETKTSERELPTAENRRALETNTPTLQIIHKMHAPNKFFAYSSDHVAAHDAIL